MDKISYSDREHLIATVDNYIIHIDNTQSKELLLSQIGQKIGYNNPINNWDALYDILRDLSWIKKKMVIIVFDTTICLEEKDLKIFIEIIADCVLDWNENEDHELFCRFIASDKEHIGSLFRQYVRHKSHDNLRHSFSIENMSNILNVN